MRRREFVVGLGSAAMLPRVAYGQQPDTPIIGHFAADEKTGARNLSGYRRGLAELGFVEGRDFRFVRKSANYQFERYPALLRELEDERAAMIVASSTAQLSAAKKATQTTPIVFTIGTDPIENGFVKSLARPGGNITGIFTLQSSVSGKRLHLLHELLPSAEKFAFLTNPNSPRVNEGETREIRTAAELARVNLVVVNARNPDEYEPAFEAAVRESVSGLIVSLEGNFTANPEKLTLLAARYRLPSIHGDDLPVRMGSLISFGADQDDSFRLVGVYAGRILKGEKPENMPVQQSTKTKLFINLRTAKELGIAVPPMLLSRADEVIE